MIGIYKITNPKGKVYIGQSTNIVERWEKGHKYGSGCGTKLKNSFNKYGWKEHKKEIIEDFEMGSSIPLWMRSEINSSLGRLEVLLGGKISSS